MVAIADIGGEGAVPLDVMMWELGKRDYIHIKYSIMCLDRFLSYYSSCSRRSEKHKREGRNLLKRNNSLHTRLKSLVEDG